MYQYDVEWFVNEDGAQVRRLILHLPEKANDLDVKTDCFCVYAERREEKGHLAYSHHVL